MQLSELPWSCVTGSLLGPLVLPITGKYTVIIQPQNGVTGTIGVTLWLSTPQTGQLNSGNASSVNINSPGQEVRLNFAGASGQAVSIQLGNILSATSCNADVQILNTDGSLLTSAVGCAGSAFVGPANLSSTGTYTVVISAKDGGNLSADVTLWLFSNQSGQLTVGTPSTITISTP